MVKNSSVPGLGRYPGEENGYPLHGEFHGQSSLVGYSAWDLRVRHNCVANTFTFSLFRRAIF